jgi:hypothetical protein
MAALFLEREISQGRLIERGAIVTGEPLRAALVASADRRPDFGPGISRWENRGSSKRNNIVPGGVGRPQLIQYISYRARADSG